MSVSPSQCIQRQSNTDAVGVVKNTLLSVNWNLVHWNNSTFVGPLKFLLKMETRNHYVFAIIQACVLRVFRSTSATWRLRAKKSNDWRARGEMQPWLRRRPTAAFLTRSGWIASSSSLHRRATEIGGDERSSGDCRRATPIPDLRIGAPLCSAQSGARKGLPAGSFCN